MTGLSRRSVLAALATGSAVGVSGCIATSAEDMSCEGDCGKVDGFGADTASGWGSKPTEMYITFTEPFSGRVSVVAKDHDGVEAADERFVQNATVVRFEFSSTVSSEDVVWRLDEGATP